ncbi:hypothetical protein NGM33_11000 [Nocardiopsis dassonvillei]|uniref:hypothetical protein n=1 Tax=Nocardiopsis dassonvillei TaxID=2014 RepID=UPI0020A59CD3|nr:hypothetical protein [Nocardiopsis dassonvillei]MCP3013857.1 hypothetical protein [Nocardiopsis dassonvillei]
MAETPLSPAASVSERDRITAGLVLARAIAEASPPEATAWQHLADFHTSVVQPLLRAPKAPENLERDRQQSLRWAGALDGADLLMRLAESALDLGALSDEAVQDLIDLCELVRATDPEGPLPSPSTADLLVGAPLGGYVVSAVTQHDDSHWSSAPGERSNIESAVDTVLRDFPSRKAAAASWPFEPHIHWPPGTPLATATTDLPMALWLLGWIFGLSAPPLLAAGHFNGTEFEPLPVSEATPLSRTARTAGRDLLVPTKTGWQRIPADGSHPTEIRQARTLGHAASEIWGEEWAQVKRDSHNKELELLGWNIVDWSRSPHEQPVPDCRVSQVWQLERYFLDKSSPGSIAVLGGNRQSGRSAIVRQLAQTLANRRRPWLVQVITPSSGKDLPERHEALCAATHAVNAHPLAASERRLLVFEDLQPTGEGGASEVLRFVATKLQITVLGVLEYSDNSRTDWNTDNTFVATAVGGPGTESRKQFVEELAREDSTLDPAPALAALKSGKTVDLCGLTRLMSAAPDIRARRTSRFPELLEVDRETLAFTAAVSLVSGEVEEERFQEMEEEDRLLFGVGPGRKPATLRIASMDDCKSVLFLQAVADGSAKPGENQRQFVNTGISQQLEPELNRLLWDGDPLAVERLHGARMYQQRICGSLLRTVGRSGALEEWVASAPLSGLPPLVGLTDLMSDDVAQKVVTQLLQRLRNWSEALPPEQLLPLMHTLQKIEYLLSAEQVSEFTAWLIDKVDAAFTRAEGRPDQRFAMLSALARFNRDDTSSLVVERSLDVLEGLTGLAEDYRLVRKVDQLQRVAARQTWSDTPLYPVDQECSVQDLLQRTPNPEDGLGVLLESMNLRLSLVDRDWEITFPVYQPALNPAFRFTSPAELAQALQGIRSPIPQFGTWLLNVWQDFHKHARELLLRQGGATDAAALLNSVSKSNVSTAFRILKEDEKDKGKYGHLVRVIAQRADKAKDGKGIGYLLSVTRSIEDLFGESGSDFSAKVADELGVDSVLAFLRFDPRGSVRYYVIKGIWDARATYRDEVLEEALSIVVKTVREGRKHWGPEIALRLLDEPELSAETLTQLQSRIHPQQLLSGMESATTAHARALFHRLGRVVHPDIPPRFLRQWEMEPFVEGLATASPTAALEVCVEVARTLTDADVPSAGREIAQATGGAEQWARRLVTGSSGEAFAQAIRSLTILDPATAGETLDRLRDVTSHVTIGGRKANVLLARLRRGLLSEPTCAPAMLRAIHRVRPELARELWTDVSADRHANFVFNGEIQQMQNPVAQATAARDLAHVGVTRRSGRAWIEPLYQIGVQRLKYFSSPHALSAQLQMISSWDPEWGVTAAQSVGTARVTRRLSFGATTDVASAVELARTMAALHNTDGAVQILDAITNHQRLQRFAEHLDVDVLCDLVDVLDALTPEAVPRITRMLDAALRSLVDRLVVAKERERWLLVGRACRVLDQLGASRVPIGAPPIAPNMAYAPAVAWAATGLNRPGWGEDALGRSAARLLSGRQVLDVTDRACVLSASGRGCAPELREGETDWNIGRAPFWLLRSLYADRSEDPYLEPVLSECASQVLARASRDTSRADWDASRLRLMLGAREFLRSRSEDRRA